MLIFWILIFIFSLAVLVKSADWFVESSEKIGLTLKLSPFIIGVTIVALGTSFPELVVSARATWQKKYEIALGNIFGSNVFNILLIAGIPALIRPLVVDELTFGIGLPFLIIATLLFIISGISRRIHIWEGAMYLLFYILFIIKLCGLF